jgi:hypothetical protein
LRLVCASFSGAFSESADYIPRSIIEGFDRFLEGVFGETYGLLNDKFEFIIQDFTDCPDERLWERIFADDFRYHMAIRVLHDLILKFGKYGAEKTFLINAINGEIPPGQRFLFNDRHFELVFLSLFYHLHHYASENQRLFDWIYGEGAAETVTEIFTAHLPGH